MSEAYIFLLSGLKEAPRLLAYFAVFFCGEIIRKDQNPGAQTWLELYFLISSWYY